MTDELKQKLLEMFEEEDLEVVEEGEWINDRKYDYRDDIVTHDGKFYRVSQSRAGSYFTEYSYGDPEIVEVERREEMKIVVSWVPVNTHGQ